MISCESQVVMMNMICHFRYANENENSWHYQLMKCCNTLDHCEYFFFPNQVIHSNAKWVEKRQKSCHRNIYGQHALNTGNFFYHKNSIHRNMNMWNFMTLSFRIRSFSFSTSFHILLILQLYKKCEWERLTLSESNHKIDESSFLWSYSNFISE